MNLAAIIIGLGALFTIITNTQKVNAQTRSRTVEVDNPSGNLQTGGATVQDFDSIYNAIGGFHNINPRLLKAIAIVESGESPNAVNPNDPSYGLMQILCSDDGQGGCANSLNVQGWPPQSREQLFDVRYNISIGAQILDWNLRQYGFPKGVAVYNAWSARNDPRGGPFRNQAYVDEVLDHFRELGGGHERDTKGTQV